MPLRWINDAPITLITGDEVVTTTKTLIDNIKAVYTSYEKDKSTVEEEALTDDFVNAKSYRGFDSDVIDDSRVMQGIFNITSEYDSYYVYRVCGLPIAIMQITNIDAYVKVDNLLVNPLASGGAGAMIEYAINQKDWAGKNPVVKLFALTTAEAAYRGIGFEDAGMDMILDLNTDHPKWDGSTGKWRYIPSDGKTGYLSKIIRPLPRPPVAQ